MVSFAIGIDDMTMYAAVTPLAFYICPTWITKCAIAVP
jgi:hypothetical protein